MSSNNTMTNNSESNDRKLSPQYLGKVCRVCGDRANGFNYNVVTCESCKAFFRRWIVAAKLPKCPFNDDCSMNSETRRDCKKCRLRKCVEVGMTRSSHMQGKPVNGALSTKTPAVDQSPPIASSFEMKPSEQTLDLSAASSNLASLDPTAYHTCSCYCSCGAFPMGTRCQDIVEAVKQVKATSSSPVSTDNTQWLLNTIDDQMDMSPPAQQDFTQIVPNDINEAAATMQIHDDFPYWLNENVTKVQEIVNAAKYMQNNRWKRPDGKPIDPNRQCTVSHRSPPFPTPQRTMNVFDYKTRESIDVAKHFSFFGQLNMTDQKALLKANVLGMSVFRVPPHFHSFSESRFASHLEQLISLTEGSHKKHFLNVRSFLQTFDPQYLQDAVLMTILQGLQLYDTRAVVCDNVQVIDQEAEIYRTMLMNHMSTKYDSTSRSVYLYHLMLAKVDEVQAMRRPLLDVFKTVEGSDRKPLMVELFDM